MSRRLLMSYVGLVYLASWSLQIAALRSPNGIHDHAALPWMIAGMFTPAIVTLAFLIWQPQTRGSLMWKPCWGMIWPLFVGVAIPTLIAFGIVGMFQLLGWGRSGWFVFNYAGVSVSDGPWVLGKGFQNWPLYTANVFLTGVWFALLNGAVALGEEIGWRGFLQGHLIARLGAIRGIALLGIIWSFWHLPSLLSGYNYPKHPLVGAFVLFPLQLVGASFFLGWLTLKARSFWPAAIAHGAVNSIQQGVLDSVHLSAPQIYEDVVRVALTMLVGMVCLILIVSAKRKPVVDELAPALVGR
ncbi:CPBP family intramembrane metalloprotease [Acidobacteria bacterium AB60]|nr:CPBP family intramembrane metalloprotease [Acidobacteria bacterium AB60]